MELVKTRMFQTIHPMTYFFVLQSMAWAVLVIMHDTVRNVNILGLAGQMIFWPAAVSYIWAISLIIASLVLIFFFLRDHEHRPRSRIMLLAKANVIIWVFSGAVWISLGFYPLVLVSMYNIIGHSYIGLAAKISRFNRRV